MTSSPLRASSSRSLPTHGTTPDDGRAHPRGEKRQLIPRQQIAAEPERQEETQQQHARHPGDFPRPAIRPHHVGGQNVQEEHADQQVGAPDMDGANEPAEIDLRHDRADTLERLVGRRLVIERQQNPRGHLDAEQKQGHPAQEIEDRRAVDGDALLGRQRQGGRQAPVARRRKPRRARFASAFAAKHVRQFRETMISSCPGFPRRVTLYSSKGRGGGPETLRPFKS